MSEHVWTRSKLVRGMAAFGLGVTMLTTLDVGAQAFGTAAGVGHAARTVEFSDESPIGTGTDPTEDGSIIIECVVLRNFDINIARKSNSNLVVMPQYPLGPTKCWPREHKWT